MTPNRLDEMESDLSSREDGFHLLNAGGGLSSPSISSISTIQIAYPFDHQYEGLSQIHPSRHTRKGSTTSLALSRKPLPPTASSPPTLLSQHSAEAPLLSSSRSKHQIISTRGSNWNWEVGALVLSFTALITLLVILIYVDGRPLDQWKSTLSLNTLVSGLGAVSRTSLGFAISSCLGQVKWNWFKKRPDNLIAFDRFDDASRGPWGSLWLIIWLRGAHWVTIGAVVTIILMGFEPFLQAVISFSGQKDICVDSSRTQLGRCEALDVGSYTGAGSNPTTTKTLTPTNLSISVELYASLPDLGIISSFNDGFYSSNDAKHTTAFTCPTANCTWPIFTSLAICSACNDMTSRLKRRKAYGTNLGTLSTNTVQIGGNYTTIALPGLNITNLDSKVENPMKGQALFSISAYLTATRLTDSQSTLSFQHLDTMITAVDILKAAAGYETKQLRWDETPVSATECALYFCVNAYESVVENGILTERILASWAERDFVSYRDSDEGNEFEIYESWNHNSLYSAEIDFRRSDLELFIPDESIRNYDLPENVTRRFRLTENTVGSTVRFVNEQLLSEYMTWPFGSEMKVMSPISQALYQSENISATFDKVAWTVSNWMRGVSNVTNPGVGQEWIIHIHVQWPYMILPLLTTFLGLLFSMWSIIETRRLHLDPWKTDMIATLTLSVDAETRAQLRHADRNGYLEKAVKTMTVTFEDSGCGLELRTKQS
ncbi:hypothetical protein F5Y13DRAFT_204215 [Hypoxylon sp. FL1857]|nr:hypothetical protein F5Y13DRAFT_204215 [Hypoxylon sp. FL1857]